MFPPPFASMRAESASICLWTRWSRSLSLASMRPSLSLTSCATCDVYSSRIWTRNPSKSALVGRFVTWKYKGNEIKGHLALLLQLSVCVVCHPY